MIQKALCVAAIMASLALRSAAVAADEGKAVSQDTAPLLIYRPVGTFTAHQSFDEGESSAPSLLRRIDLIFARIDMPVDMRAVPVKRALSLYDALSEGCIMAPATADSGAEVNSQRVMHGLFWLYVMADRGFTSRDDIRSFATIDGADQLLGQVTMPGAERIYVPNFKVLVSMLESGRVDSIPVGNFVLETMTLPAGMVRLDDEPVIVLDSVIRCKRTPRTEQLVLKINQALETLPERF